MTTTYVSHMLLMIDHVVMNMYVNRNKNSPPFSHIFFSLLYSAFNFVLQALGPVFHSPHSIYARIVLHIFVQPVNSEQCTGKALYDGIGLMYGVCWCSLA